MNLNFCKSIQNKYEGKSDVKEIVAFILGENILRCCNQQLYFYYKERRYYIPVEKQNEWHVISCFISEALLSSISHSKADEIINRIKDTYKIQMTVDDFNPDIYSVNLLNGVYSFKEQQLYPQNDKASFNYFLNVKYIEQRKRKMPAFDYFCKTSLAGDSNKRAFLLQMIGYCCTQLTAAKKCFILLGPPNCGKSLILHLMEYIVGEDYISNIQLENLGNRFSTAVLYKKILNICGELSARPLKNIETFKLVVGGDTLSGEFKGKDVFQFKNKCKLIYAGNILPPVKNEDISTAFVNRISLLVFPNSIKKENQMPNLIDKLKEEADSIFSEAIDAVAQLINNNYTFPVMEDADTILSDYSFQQTHIDNFIEECCIIGSEYKIHTVALYERYIEFCAANGVKAISQNLFSQKINSVKGVQNKRFRSGTGDSRRGFIGIAVKNGVYKIPKRNTSIYKRLKTAEQRNRGENMSKPISARIDDELYKLIEQYAASRGLNFTQALITMLESKDVIILEEGVEILNCLNDIAYYLQNVRLPDKSQKRNIREVCDELWQLLDSLTRKTAETKKDDIL